MALWNKVLSGFDAEEETVNFGARTVAESHDSVYETATLATIQPDGEVVKNPTVFASIHESTLCVTIDKSITVFADQSCREIRLCVGFNYPITSHCLSKNFYYLFVTLTNGSLYCLNLEAGGPVVFQRNVIQKYDTPGEVIVKVFVNQEERDDASDLLLVTSRGRIFGVSGFNKNVMDAVLDVDDSEELGNLTRDIQCRLLETQHHTQEVTSAEVNSLHEQQSVVMIGREIYVWPNRQFCSLSKLPYRYRKVQYLKNSSYYLCLRTDGALNLVCAATLLARKVWDGPATDMVIVEDEVDGPTQILVLLKPEEGSFTTFIQLVSFPDFQVRFNLRVATTTYLVDQGGRSIDEIVFLEGVGETLDAIDTVKIKAIEENLPECRLQRLLRRGKYDEAKIFAKQFHLSTDIIYCAKASSLSKQISFSTPESDLITRIDELVETLDNIKNAELVFGYCHNTVTSNLEQTKRLISYARERLIKDAEKTNDELIATHLSNLNSTLYRIETHEMICRTRENKAESINGGVAEWIKFSKSDLLSECKNYLMHGELKVAALIWVRHSSSLLAHVSSEVVRDILGMIPGGIRQSDLWPWLYHFVPSLLAIYPDGLSEIVTWGYKRAKSFENFDETNWPQSGLDFCKSFMKLLNFEESQSFFHLQEQYKSEHSPLQHLTAVIQALTDLQHLKENYRFVVKINSYMGEPTEVAHSLLHEVRAQEISNFVDNFLHQYMLNHSLQNDHILILYIQKLLKKSRGWWFTQHMADSWEEKISSVIGCIHNVESRLQQTLETLREAYVPWSSTMQELVESCISIKHSLVLEIITERNLVATKLIWKKYGYQHVGVTDNLIKRIIKENRDEMLEDLYELTKSNNSSRIRALCICVNFFLNKGDLGRTMSVIKNLTDEDAIYCCKQIIHYIGTCLGFKEMNNTADYYAELLGTVQSKLKSLLLPSSGTEDSPLDDTLATASELKSICLLRKEFGINLTLAEYQSRTETVLQMHLENLCNESHNKELSSFLLYKKALRIADLLEWPRILAVCLLLENSRDSDILKYYIQGIQGTGSIPADECPYVKRLCRICIFNLNSGELEALGSLKDVSASALDNCSVGELSQTLLTTVWSHLSHRITTTEAIGVTDIRNGLNADTVKWRLYNIYTDTAMGCGRTILPFCIQALKFSSMCTDKERLEDDASSEPETRSNQLADLIASVGSIPSENYDFPLLQILNSLISTCGSSTTMNEKLVAVIEEVRNSCLYMLLQKIISARRFDLQSGLSCLSTLSEQEAFKWLTSTCQKYQTDYLRLRAVSDLGHAYCHLMKNKSHMKYFTYYRTCHYWAKKLSAHGISQKEILTSHTEGKQEILERLMRSEKSGFIGLMKEYCTDFEFDIDECYVLYLDVLLKQWNPTIKIVTLNNEKELKINQDEVAALHKTCKQVAALIEDKSAMQKHLVSLWSKINFYHYEVFLLIMEILDIKNQTRFEHLCFLQNYVRFGSPTQIEYEEWSLICPEDNSLPPISKWRLPFLPKVDQWKLITPELNLSTYEKWMEIAPILKLHTHLICTMAIKESVNQVWMASPELKKRNPNEWLIHSKHSALLKDIKACINHMTDQEALYYGTAALYYVVNHTPAGADQAAAAQECYASAQKWAQASVESDKAMIEKIKYKYLQLTAKHILHTHGLGSSRYLQLAISPERLVRELYMDESIVLRSRGATEHRPDINSAVNLLGKIFSLNVIQLRLELLEEWLQPSDGNCKLDDSISCNIAVLSNRTEDDGTDDDNLLRACYILEWGDKTMSANYLINIGFGEKHETSSRPGIQFRALHVLLSITDSATVQDLTKRDLQSIKQYMKSLRYVSELEKLGFTFSVHRFESASKLELAQALFRGHANLPEALVLILQICVDFELKNYTLWDGTLSKMAKMYMIKELGKFLPKVSTVSHAVGCNGYIQGWEVLISDSFRRTDALLSREQFDDCLSSICLLHSCPVSRKLDLKPIIDTCFQSRHPELAAALLPFLNENDATFVLQKIRSSCDTEKIMEDLRTLSSRQILTISYSVRMLEEFLESDVSKIR